MTQLTRDADGCGCHPGFTPADQPPIPNHEACAELPYLKPPADYHPAGDCDAPCACNCPQVSAPSNDCIQDLIANQNKELAKVDQTKALKADLESLQQKADQAEQLYTTDFYERNLKAWKCQDKEIVDLINALVCARPCWRCIIECFIGPAIKDLHKAEGMLRGDGTLPAQMHSIHDMLYWRERNLAVHKARYDRIKEVLKTWEKPTQTIEQRLADNCKLITASRQNACADPKVVFDVFLKLVPMHLAIAPPARDSNTTTAIDKKFTVFCECDTTDPDNCCGPDVGLYRWSLRQQLIKPQPYLIKPEEYRAVICCLITNRLGPAKENYIAALAEKSKVEGKVQAYCDFLAAKLKDFEKWARPKIPNAVRCNGEALADPDPVLAM
jgi:hypothetical protein